MFGSIHDNALIKLIYDIVGVSYKDATFIIDILSIYTRLDYSHKPSLKLSL